MGGGSDLTLAAPFPLDPLANSKSAAFIVRVVIFGLDGAPALCFFDFFKDVLNGLLGLRSTPSSQRCSQERKGAKNKVLSCFFMKIVNFRCTVVIFGRARPGLSPARPLGLAQARIVIYLQTPDQPLLRPVC